MGQIYFEKNQKNAPWNSSRDGFFAVEPKQPERKRSSDKSKYARTGKFLKLFVHKKHNNLHVSSYFKVHVAARFVPQTIP